MLFKKYFILVLLVVFSLVIDSVDTYSSSGQIELPNGFDTSHVMQLNSPKVKEYNNDFNIDFTSMEEIDFDGWVRVGIMVPLSGRSSSVGQSLKNAAEIALFSSGNKKIILQFYDTNNATNGIAELTKQAISERVNIILGPLFATEVDDVSRVARSYGVPVLTFSNDEVVLQDSRVHSMNYLLSQEIDRVVGFTSSNGRKMIAAIIPEGESEEIVVSAINKAAEKYSVKIYNIAKYKDGNQQSIVEAVQKISEYESRSKTKDKIKTAAIEKFTELKCEDVINNKTSINVNTELGVNDVLSACKNLEILNKRFEPINAVGQIPYDAIFIYGDNKNLVSIGSYLLYYDVNPKAVRFVGTSAFDNKEIFAERGYYGAWFTSKNNSYSRAFENEYRTVFNEYPSRLAMFAYDAVSVIAALSNDGRFYVGGLNSPSGFFGISGLFKFARNGEVMRSFDVKQVLPRTSQTLSIAAKSFDEMEKQMLENIEKSKSYSDEKIVEKIDIDWIIENLPLLKLEDINNYVIE
ncbi:MAG: penicillin-binding protein activator [Rickettsiales bacterium]|jgi:ABC-type branched-subunit amino acid transport system substrate-binding protein|nr:penicillin-binding protein activator [Rickettsiales bacterium]